jgi:hypothetical protein
MTDPTFTEYTERRHEVRRHVGMLEPLSAALRDDGETLHQHVAKLDLSSRTTLFHACAAVMNALAAADAEFERLRTYARQLSPIERAFFAVDPSEFDRAPKALRDAAAQKYIRDGMVMPDGSAFTDRGREVRGLVQADELLRSQVRDRALSDEDLCHE